MRRARPARISLLLADVDGTLVTHDKVLTERARAAVHRLHEQGIRFAITSGRPPIDPDVEPVLGNEPDRCLRDLWRQCVGVDHGEIRLDEDAAVEGGNGRVDPEGIREHDHAAWRGNEWFVRNPDGPTSPASNGP